jgi:hypothetical protein
MSVRVIKDSMHKANKDYRCDACDAILQSMVYPDDFDEYDLSVLKIAENSGWMINKGETYSKQVNAIEDRMNTFRSRPEVLEIYFKYDINDT